jgi:uncharacterized lipoprotein YajG
LTARETRATVPSAKPKEGKPMKPTILAAVLILAACAAPAPAISAGKDFGPNPGAFTPENTTRSAMLKSRA